LLVAINDVVIDAFLALLDLNGKLPELGDETVLAEKVDRGYGE
jgi:hypothetical protein